MKRAFRVLALLAGLGLFVWFVQRAGLGEIWGQVRGLEWSALWLLVPYGLVYCLDNLGWYLTFGSYTKDGPSYGALFRVRWCGEFVNNVIPSAYVGGEAVKVYLLHKRGMAGLVAGASVVASKTSQVLAQVLFIGVGALLAFSHLPPESGARRGMAFIFGGATVVVVGLFWLQRHGLFSGLQTVLNRFSIRIRALESRREALRKLDDQVFRFYHGDPGRFFAVTTVYFLGWLVDALEVYLACWLLGQPVSWGEAVAIEAFISVAKALGVFVPGALGVQESGVVLLFHIFGLPVSLGATYAILRRGRDVIFALVGGLLLLQEEHSIRNMAQRIHSQETGEKEAVARGSEG